MTARRYGRRPIGKVYSWFINNYDPLTSGRVLDFGAGWGEGTELLREHGFRCEAYDLHPRREFIKEDLLHEDCRFVLLSNVLNVQATKEELFELLRDVAGCMHEYAEENPDDEPYAIANFPASPRKLEKDPGKFLDILGNLWGEACWDIAERFGRVSPEGGDGLLALSLGEVDQRRKCYTKPRWCNGCEWCEEEIDWHDWHREMRNPMSGWGE